MQIRYFQGLAGHLLSRSGVTVGPLPSGETGLQLGGLRLRFVRASPDRPGPGDAPDVFDPAGFVFQMPALDVPAKLDEAAAERLLKALLEASGDDGVTGVQTLAEWGKTRKQHGLRVECTDGSEIYATFL